MRMKSVGLTFVIISGLMSFSNIFITGAVVGSLLEEYLPMVTFIFLIFGLFLLVGHFREGGRSIDSIVEGRAAEPIDAARRLNRIPDQASVVMDTSYILEYKPNRMKEVLEHLDEGRRVVVPNSVLDELDPRNKGSPYVELLLDDERVDEQSPEFQDYMNVARQYLEKSGKKLMRDKLVPIITGEASAPVTNREAAPLRREMKNILFNMKRRGIRNPTKEDVLETLDRHYEVSHTDVEVLASAIAEAYAHPNENVVVAGRDRDFEYAIELMKKGGEGLLAHEVGRRLFYSGPQELER